MRSVGVSEIVSGSSAVKASNRGTNRSCIRLGGNRRAEPGLWPFGRESDDRHKIGLAGCQPGEDDGIHVPKIDQLVGSCRSSRRIRSGSRSFRVRRWPSRPRRWRSWNPKRNLVQIRRRQDDDRGHIQAEESRAVRHRGMIDLVAPSPMTTGKLVAQATATRSVVNSGKYCTPLVVGQLKLATGCVATGRTLVTPGVPGGTAARTEPTSSMSIVADWFVSAAPAKWK